MKFCEKKVKLIICNTLKCNKANLNGYNIAKQTV